MTTAHQIYQRLLSFVLTHRWPAVFIAASLIFVITSVGLSLHASLWYDEAFSVALASQPLNQLFHYAVQDVHPPLYYLLLKGWIWIFGSSEVALRAPSILATLASGWLIFFALSRRITTVRVAAITASLMLLSPMVLRYSFEVRMYSLVMLVGLAATLWLPYALTSTNRTSSLQRWGLYGLLVLIGMYLHYFTVFIWLAHAAWLGAMLLFNARRALRVRQLVGYITAIAAAFVLFLPQLSTALHQARLIDERTSRQETITLLDVATTLVNGLTYPELSGSVTFYLVSTVITVGLIGTTIYYWRSASAIPHKSLWLAISLIPPLLSYIATRQYQTAYYDRYLLPSLAAMITLFGIVLIASLAKLQGLKKIGAIVGLSMLSLSVLVGNTQVIYHGNQNTSYLVRSGIKQLMVEVNQIAHPDDIILLDRPRQYYEVNYYNQRQLVIYAYDLDGDTVRGGGLAMITDQTSLLVRDLASLAQPGRSVWYVHDAQQSVIVAPHNWRLVRTINHSPDYIAAQYSVVSTVVE